MLNFETLWRFVVTSLAVWRLSRVFFLAQGGLKRGEDASGDTAGARFWAARVTDLICWISVWMSSQTAIWVVGGFAGVLLSWLAASGVSRLLAGPAELPVKGLAKPMEMSRREEMPSLPCGARMQVHHG